MHRLYKAATDATERTNLQIIWLLTSGRSAQFVAEVTGDTPRWVSVIAGHDNRAGGAGLGDQRQFNPGSRRMRGIRLPPQGTPDRCSTQASSTA
ncbi:hypothetical protein [Azospirillum canadense]|uniref:hypothetical protein n=1 Tax=Azospirillum canadense TaxID=403962 RepID=UPI002225FE11|nr:hypothetical protein [Azospirillum canadense]MCW2239078.1 hypothetical protein [Azospirillum canadense]